MLSIQRCVLSAAFLGFLNVCPDLEADELTDAPPPLPEAVANDVAANLVDLTFLFDRIGSKAPRAVTRDYMKRVSEPASPFYRDYLLYRQGKISRIELVDRLPHVAMLGDSLTQHFYFSSLPSSFWRARTAWRENWFLDTDPKPQSVLSVYERLELFTPLVAAEHNGAGALVAPIHSQEGLRKKLVRARNLPGQSRQVLRQNRFPDLIMIWIGHNNLDWVHDLSPEERKHPEKRLAEMATRFRQSYTETLRPIVDRAKTENHRVAIVIFGLANIDAYLQARRMAEILHAKNPKLYPHLDSGERTFESLKPPYQKNMTRLSLMLNAEMRTMIGELDRELRDHPSVRVQYSDGLTKVDLSRLKLIHPVDAWHPSTKGHTALAEAAFRALTPSLDFLGITSRSSVAPKAGNHDAIIR